MPTRTQDIAALHAAMSRGQPPTLIDVRSAMEFAGGHVPGAVNIPLGVVAGRASQLPQDKEVWLICRSGGRSASAAQQLSAKGLAVVNVEGGTQAWSAAGHELQHGSPFKALLIPGILCLTLGLAPFTPEPHLVGKLRWLAGGGVGMAPADVFDLVMHAAPWAWLALKAVGLLRGRSTPG